MLSLQYSLKANTVKIPAYQNGCSVFDNTLQEPQVITCVPLLYHELVPGTNLNNFQMGAFLGYNENKC